MDHKVNYILLQSQSHDPATDHCINHYVLLIRKTSEQLEGLTRNNKLKGIAKSTNEIINHKLLNTNKANNETKLNTEINSYKLEIEHESKRHSSIGSKVISTNHTITNK